MSDTNGLTVDTSVGGETSYAFEPGSERPVEVSGSEAAYFDEVPKAKKEVPASSDAPAGDAPKTDAETGTESGHEQVDEGEDTTTTEETTSEGPQDLGAYDPENPETAARFDAAYFTEAGKLNQDRLSEEFWANAAKGAEHAGLNEGTYAYLEDRLGLTKEQAKQLEAGLVANHEKAQQAVYERVGGKEALNAAMEWARGGGYSEAERAAFNAKQKDPAAANEAIDALMFRFQKATGGKAPEGQRQGPKGRPTGPERSATAGAAPAAKAVQGFATRAAFNEAFQEAHASKDKAKMAEVDRKWRASDRSKWD